MEKLIETIDTKANKSSVANALHRKANKLDVQDVEKVMKEKQKDIFTKLDKMMNDLCEFFKENANKNKSFDDGLAKVQKDQT